MKILILANNDVGLFKFRKELLEKLNKENTVYVSVPKGDYISDIKSLGCKVILNPYLERRGINLFQELKLLLYYKRFIKKLSPEMVITFTIKPNIYGGIACAQFHIAYIANITGLGTAIENGGVLQKIILLLYKISLRNSEKVFFENRSNQRFMKKYAIVRDNCEVLPGAGVNLCQHCYEEYPDRNKDIVFLTVGRIMKDKGIDELLEASEIIKKKYPKVKFRLVGPFDEEYQEKVYAAVEKGRLEYVGEQRDVHAFIKDCHAIVHPSYHEGMSNALLEAASSGRPILATDIPGCREAFEEGVSGLKFKAKSSSDLVRVLEQFICFSYEEKRDMGIAGRKRMERFFDRDFVVEKYMEQLKRISKRQG